jgi:hypothetical protein
MDMKRCFACGKKLGKNPARVDTMEDQFPFVWTECLKLIIKAGTEGYQPPQGGPKLYRLQGERLEYFQKFMQR